MYFCNNCGRLSYGYSVAKDRSKLCYFCLSEKIMNVEKDEGYIVENDKGTRKIIYTDEDLLNEIKENYQVTVTPFIKDESV